MATATTTKTTHMSHHPTSPTERHFHKERVLYVRAVHVEAEHTSEVTELAQILHLYVTGNRIRGQRLAAYLRAPYWEVAPQDKSKSAATQFHFQHEHGTHG